MLQILRYLRTISDVEQKERLKFSFTNSRTLIANHKEHLTGEYNVDVMDHTNIETTRRRLLSDSYNTSMRALTITGNAGGILRNRTLVKVNIPSVTKVLVA